MVHPVILCGDGCSNRPDAASRWRTPSRYLRISPPASASSFSRAAYSSSKIGSGFILETPQEFGWCVDQQVRKSKFLQCLVNTGKGMCIRDMPTVLRQKELYTTDRGYGNMQSVQTRFCGHQGPSDQFVGNAFHASINRDQRNSIQQTHPFGSRDGIAQTSFVEHKLRSYNNEFRPFNQPPLTCLLLQERDSRIRTGTSRGATDD